MESSYSLSLDLVGGIHGYELTYSKKPNYIDWRITRLFIKMEEIQSSLDSHGPSLSKSKSRRNLSGNSISSQNSNGDLENGISGDDQMRKNNNGFNGKAARREGVLVWRDLTITMRGKRTYSDKVIKSCTGYALPGTLTVIMGPAKSGKTTLLRALAGLLKPRRIYIAEI